MVGIANKHFNKESYNYAMGLYSCVKLIVLNKIAKQDKDIAELEEMAIYVSGQIMLCYTRRRNIRMSRFMRDNPDASLKEIGSI